MKICMVRLMCAFMLICVAPTVHGQGNSSDSTINLDTLKISAIAGPVPYQASAPIIWDIIHTRVALSFDQMNKTADVREWIHLRPHFYSTDTLELDAKGMRIDSVLLVGKKGNTYLKHTYKDDKLKIWTGKIYTANDTLQLFLKYTAIPYAATGKGSAAITEDRGLYFINTDKRTPNKQAHIWTQGETESNSHWMITIDKPNTRFTCQVELTVADSLTTLSNGALIKQQKLPKGMRTDVWRIDMPIQAYAVMFAISNYAVVRDNWKGKEVSYYVEPSYASYARNMFRYTTEMMDFFSEKTGVPYPWNKYSQVVVRDYVSGAMENTTASLFGEFINQTDKEIADKDYEDIVAHELFHQWFGDYVTAEAWSNTTQNESFANYGEQLWRNYKHGTVAGAELAWNDLQLYILSSRGHDPQLVRFNYDSREEMFDAISYNKGGAILHYLNTLIGDAAFENAMRLYLTQNALKPAEAHHWRLAVEEITGQDWNWFFNQWYYHAGHPVLKVNYNYSDSAQALIVEVSQTQDDSTFTYTLPLKTEIVYGDKIVVVDWNITKRKQTFIYPYKGNDKPVIIPDFTHVLPGEIKENKKAEQWLKTYVHASNYISKRIAIAGAGKTISDSSAQALIDIALNDTTYLLRKYALDQLEKVFGDKYRKRWASKVIDMANGDANNHVRAAAFDVLATWKTPTAKPILFKGVWDSSYMVAGAALDALDKQDNDTAYAIAKALLNAKPGGALESPIWKIIAKKAMASDIALFEEKAPWVFANKRLSFGLAVSSYLKNVSDNDAFLKAANIYADLTIYETMKSYRAMIGGFFFQSYNDQKELLKDEDKEIASRAEARMPGLNAIVERVISEERDDELKEKFKTMMKDKE